MCVCVCERERVHACVCALVCGLEVAMVTRNHFPTVVPPFKTEISGFF